MLLDTHTLIWAMMVPEKLSRKAHGALSKASNRAVSSVSLYEITLKASLGKWPEVDHLLSIDLTRELQNLDFDIIPANGQIMERAGSFKCEHRDHFDRIIVATGIEYGLDLVSKDTALDVIADGKLNRIW